MKNRIFRSIIFSLTIPLLAHAEVAKNSAKSPGGVIKRTTAAETPEVACEPLDWVFSRKRTLSQLQADFSQIPRAKLIRYGWTELLKNPTDSLAIPMLYYLSETTNIEKLHQYFEAMGFLVLPDELTPSEAIASWPKITQVRATPVTLEKMCEVYKKSLADETEP